MDKTRRRSGRETTSFRATRYQRFQAVSSRFIVSGRMSANTIVPRAKRKALQLRQSER